MLICSGLNHDALNAYHAQRLLAEELSQSGFPTLRFDYPHTGDSADIDGLETASDIDLWQIWLDSVNQAADMLRRSTGARQVIFCGLRIGATLAALTAARRDDAAGLILLSPVIRGQSYLRQIWIEAQLYEKTLPPIEDGVRFQDICFNRVTVRSLSAVDLRRASYKADFNIAVFAQSQGRIIEDCCSAWTSHGAAVLRSDFSGLEPMLSLNVEDDKAHPNFEQVMIWVSRLGQGQAPVGATQPQDNTELTALTPGGCIETPLRFGTGEKLFGILCRPEKVTSDEIIIVANAGRDPRHSPGRFNVEFSRWLAREGVASLRFDFAGLGDSIGPAGQESLLSPLMDLERSSDVSAAIDALAPFGFRNFTAYGLCAGAYHVMRAAVADPRISRLLLVNIPLFSWSSGERIDFMRHKNMPLRYYLVELGKLKSWNIAKQKLRKSGSVLRGQALRLSTRIANASWSPLKWLDRVGGVKLTAGQRNMQILSRRRVKTLLLYGEGDLGLDAVVQEFGALDASPALGENVTLRILADFDHLVSHERTRRNAALSMLQFLEQTRENSQRHAAPAEHVAGMEAGLLN